MFVVSVINERGSDRYLLAAAAAEAVGFAEQLAWADGGKADRLNHKLQGMWLWTGSWQETFHLNGGLLYGKKKRWLSNFQQYKFFSKSENIRQSSEKKKKMQECVQSRDALPV